MKNFKDADWRKKITEVLNQIEEKQIRFARLQFIDVNGIPKVLLVPTRGLELIFEDGRSFDGS